MNWIEYTRNRPRMMPEGSGSSGIFCMGEALGEREEIDRLPFRPFAPAGSLFDRALRRAGIARSSLTISNVVWYRPPENWLAKAPWEFEAIAHSRPLNNALIEKVKPKVIVALGGTAFRELTGLQGDKLGILNTRGFIVPSSLYPGIPVIGAIHPSAMRRGSKERNSNESSRTEAPGGGTVGMSLLGVLIRDLRLAQEVAKEGVPRLLERRDHRLGATMDDWRNAIREARDNPQLIISYDFETWKSLEEYDESETEHEVQTPTQFQISLRKNHAVVSPWNGDLLPILRELFALPNPKLDWNGRGFDRKLLRDLQVRMDVGTWHDGMDLWHHAQPDIPKGLQFAASFACPEFGPWKHLAFSDPLFYGALDVDAPQWIWDFMQNLKEKRHPISQISLWTGYETQVVEVAPVLDGMSARGIPVDEEKRQELDLQFTAQLEQMNAESQSFFPDQLRNLHPKKGYKRTPKDTTGMQQRTVWDVEKKGSTELVPFVRWCKLEPFLMSSPQQVMRYLKWKEYDIPHHPKTDKETTDELSLRKLITKHKDPLLIRILDYREIAKARSGYVLKWKPGIDGRVHPFFGFGPATGQLNCVAEWTLVSTEYGKIPIKALKIGDKVWTHEHRWKRVTQKWIKGISPMFAVEFDNGEVLTCTGGHVLLCSHEHIEAGHREPASSAGSFGNVQVTRVAGSGRNCSDAQDNSTYSRLDIETSPESGRVRGHESGSILPIQDGSKEPNERETAPELRRRGGRWVRVFDLYEGWKAAVCSSYSNGRGVGIEGDPRDFGCTSHQRGSQGQLPRQSSSRYEEWASANSLPASEGSGIRRIKKIYPVGSHEVHDITVEEDESYAACGVFSHNSKDPNAQNFPKHAEIARIMRRMIRTEKRFISFDWKSFHVLTLGFEAQDASYMRMARLDMHSFFALVGLLRLEQPEKVLSLNDAELMDKLSWYRKQTKTYPQFACTAHPGGMTFGEIRDERAKRAILGVGFGQTGPGLYKRNPESFGRMNDAIECIKMLNRVFPLPEAWRGAVRLEADRFASLMTRYGYIRWFWDVFSKRLVSWDYQPRGSQKLLEDSDGRRWLIEPGDDHEACVAYRPANDAFGIKRSVIAELGRNGWDERFGLIDEIHDDLTFECAVDRVDECIPTVKHIMERPSLILSDPLVAPQGLSCSVEVSIGQNWDFKDPQNPIGMEKIKV